ncbi:MAG: hypothetical protein P4L50_00075 [Anaerolineaceae bacterium]|nr:hypothetical protein [Anaerolineaceae bacterium]
MTCIYDEKIFRHFRALAVTNVEDLKPGEIYYTNGHPDKFVVDKVISEEEHDKLCEYQMPSKSAELTWIIPIGYNDYMDTISLHDFNIGASYNPWLVFKDEKTALDCREQLKVKIQGDKYDYDYPDFDDD